MNNYHTNERLDKGCNSLFARLFQVGLSVPKIARKISYRKRSYSVTRDSVIRQHYVAVTMRA